MNATHRDKQILLSLTVCGMAFAAGCAPGRLDDLKDCGRISIGLGMGLEAHAKVGSLTQPTIGLGSASVKIGHEDRSTTLLWGEFVRAWPAVWMADRTEYVDSNHGLNVSGDRGAAFHRSTLENREYYWIPLLSADADYDPLAFSEITDLQAGAAVGPVSAHVGVNPLEIVDFALGFVGLDIAGDDPKPPETQDQSEDNSEKTPPEGQATALTGIND